MMLMLWTLVVVALLALVTRWLRHGKYHLPPGPPGLPFIGNALQLDKVAPHKTITEWSEQYGDVFTMKLFGQSAVVLNSFETIYDGLVTKANQFAGRVPSFRSQTLLQGVPDVASSTFSPKWVFLKKATMQSLKMYGENMKNLERVSLELINTMLEELKAASSEGPSDILPIYHRCAAGIITSILYGKKMDKATSRTIMECTNEGMALVRPVGLNIILDIMPFLRHFPNHLYRRLNIVGKTFRQVCDQKFQERKALFKPGEPKCFIDGLLEQQRNNEKQQTAMNITDAEICGININLVVTGTFTTSESLCAIIAFLINKPEIQHRMAAEIRNHIEGRAPRLADRKVLHYVEATILEVLRNCPIVPLNVPHYTMEDTTMKGFDIPKDTMVLFNLWKLHHNPDIWEDPWEFKPERFLDKDGTLLPCDHFNMRRLMAFGASRRVCVGENLARNRLFLMLTSLLQHFELLPAGPDEMPRHDPRDYRQSFGIVPHRYRVKLVPRC